MMRRLVSALLPLVFLVLSGLPALASPPSDEATAAAHAMADRFADSWNRADGTAYGENYWPDAELVDPSGTLVEGRAAIVKQHVDLWAGIFKGTRQQITIRRVKVLCPNYIVVDIDARLAGWKALPPGATATANGVLLAHLRQIMEKRHGAWRIALSQNTIVAHPNEISH